MAERASDQASRASELSGMAFEIAFETAGRVGWLVLSERALEPYERASKPSGKQGRVKVRQ